MRLRAAVAVITLLLCAPAWADEKTQVMGTKEDRVFWVIPNYQTVQDELSLPTISAQDKFRIALKDSFDPYAFPIAGVFAGISHIDNENPSWGRGPDGFGKRYIAALADQTMSNMLSEAAFPILLHQDPRFFRLGRGGFWHRLGYAASRVFVTRGDDGSAQFNASEFAGNAVMAAAGNLYRPRQDRGVGESAENFGLQIGVDLVGGVFKEFWPDIKEKLTGRRPTRTSGRSP
ncbi:MAG: hypothetical protein NTY77_13050 [Elusimicrobia bacterium]|nr:hypothetical protein [Elusimicrobiota bacterium]